MELKFGDWVVTPIEHQGRLWWIPYQLAPLLGRQLPSRYSPPNAYQHEQHGWVVTTNYLGLWYQRAKTKDVALGRLLQQLIEHERQWRQQK